MLKLENICFEADGKKILNNVSLDIDDRFVAITGPNGSGKSTLAKIIMGIMQPTSGRIYFNDVDITDMPIDQRANLGISYAFQQPVRFKGLKVRDLLEIPSANHKSDKPAALIRRACDALSEVGLCARDYIDRELNDTLSGGEMKRIEIAMTASRGTELSIFDEPEAGIDLWSFQSLIKVFEKLHAQTSGSIVIISHQERILSIADKIIYLKDGVVEKYAAGAEVMESLQLTQNQACPVLMEKM